MIYNAENLPQISVPYAILDKCQLFAVVGGVCPRFLWVQLPAYICQQLMNLVQYLSTVDELCTTSVNTDKLGPTSDP